MKDNRNKEIKQFDTLTGLRFFAAIHVVLFHNFSFFALNSSISPYITNFINKGEAAVSFFFILSGFILTHSYKDRMKTREHKKRYLIARISKLYPLYFFAFLIDLPRGINYFFSKYDLSQAALKAGISSFSYLTMTQSWYPRVTASWNSPAWSLSCELFFYLCFIFMINRLLKIKRLAIPLFVLYFFPILLYFLLITITPQFTNSNTFQTFWRSFPLIKLNEFIIGILIYNLYQENVSIYKFISSYSNLFFWGAIIISIVLSTFARPYISREIFSSLLYVPLFGIMILAGLSSKIKGQNLFNSKMAIHMGLISYAIYICHQPIAYYFDTLIEDSPLKGVMYLLLVIFLSHLLYKFIERPFQRLIKLKSQ